jgi:CelD/BcsL family acetyltransferase involved in cellulose biosynthesis
MKVVVISTGDAIGSYIIDRLRVTWPGLVVVKPAWGASDKSSAEIVRSFARAPFRTIRRGYLDRRSSRGERELVRLLLPAGREPSMRCVKVPSRQLNENPGVALLRSLEPEVLILCGCPILKEPVLAVPTKATVNVHFGIAPSYRGEDAVFHALRRGDPAHAGVSLHHVDLGVDTGRLLAIGRPAIDTTDTEAVALAKCARLAVELLDGYLAVAEHDDVPGVTQDPGGRTYRYADRRVWHDLQFSLKRGLGRMPSQPNEDIEWYFDVSVAGSNSLDPRSQATIEANRGAGPEGRPASISVVAERQRSRPRVTLEVRTTLGPFRDQWDALVAADTVPIVDWRSWWLEGVADPQTRFLLVVEDDRLLGGLAIERHRVLGVPAWRLAGHDRHVTDGDILATAGAEDTVVACLQSWFRALGGCLVDLNGVRQDSLLRTTLPPGVGAYAHALGGAPVARFPDGFDAYLLQRSGSWRSNYRRDARRLDAWGYCHRRLPASEIEAGLTALRLLHGQRFSARSDFLPFFEHFAAAARIGSSKGEVAFHVLARDDDIIAVNVVIEVNAYWSYYQGGRNTVDPRLQGAGTVLLGKIIEDGCIRGAHSLDLGLRADTYKLRMADEVRPALQFKGGVGWAAPVAQGADVLRQRAPQSFVSMLRSTRRRARGLDHRLRQATGR